MASPIMTIFHMSDIHIGEAGVKPDEFRRAIDNVERLSKDKSAPLLLITGDLTSDGLKEEYEAFNDAIIGIEIPTLIIPGNHDERNYGTVHFERLYGSRFKTYVTDVVAIFAADSAEPDTDAGHVGRAYYPKIRNFFTIANDKFRIFTLHHHLIPVPYTGREHNVVQDAGDILGILQEVQCDLVLNGHRHVPWMWTLNNMILYTTGTLLSKRIRGASLQSYTRLELYNDSIKFILCQRDDNERVFSESAIRL